MAADDDDLKTAPDDALAAPGRTLRRWWRVLLGVGLLIVLALIIAWFSRERIAENIVSGQLDSLGLPATYQVEAIGTDEQVLRNVVIGDPQRPDRGGH